MASTHITNRPTPQIPADADPPSDAHPYAAFTRPRETPVHNVSNPIGDATPAIILLSQQWP